MTTPDQLARLEHALGRARTSADQANTVASLERQLADLKARAQREAAEVRTHRQLLDEPEIRKGIDHWVKRCTTSADTARAALAQLQSALSAALTALVDHDQHLTDVAAEMAAAGLVADLHGVRMPTGNGGRFLVVDGTEYTRGVADGPVVEVLARTARSDGSRRSALATILDQAASVHRVRSRGQLGPLDPDLT